MKIEEFIKGMKYLSLAYNKEFNKEQCEVWYDSFKSDNYDVFRSAIKRLVSKNKFLPSIAEIKQEMAILTNTNLQLNAEEEWEKVKESVRKFGYYRQDEALKSLNPYTRDIARQINYSRICSDEGIQWVKRDFIELFNMNKGIEEKILMINEPELTIAELKKISEMRKENLLLEDNG